MAYRTPEIASRFGALDPAAFDDGAARDAHLSRVVAMSSNHLAS